jgi:hypothetical protein
MGEQTASGLIGRRKCDPPEDDRLSYGIGFGFHSARRTHRPFVRVHTDLTKIKAETGFEEGASGRVKWLPGRAEHLMHNGGGLAGSNLGRSGPVGLKRLRLFLLAAAATAADLWWRGGYGDFGGAEAHHLIGDAVRLVLKRVVYPPDGEICGAARAPEERLDRTDLRWLERVRLTRTPDFAWMGCAYLRSSSFIFSASCCCFQSSQE